MEGLSKSVANLIVYVHPSQSKNVDKAILRELSSLLFKYSKDFDGVVLAYSVEPRDKCARILTGVHPYFGVRLQANMLIFSPKPGMLLEGKVVKLTRESIHCIVLGFSSAIVTDENIRKTCLDEEILHISGSLIPANTGSAHWMDKYFVDAATDSNKEARRQPEEEVEMQMKVTAGRETLPLVNDHEVKKSKKRRRAEDQ